MIVHKACNNIPPKCFLRFSAKICGFLRKSAVFCGFLCPPNAGISRRRGESAKVFVVRLGLLGISQVFCGVLFSDLCSTERQSGSGLAKLANQAARDRSLAHRNRSDFCDLRLRCPSRTPEIAAISETRESNAALRFKAAMESH